MAGRRNVSIRCLSPAEGIADAAVLALLYRGAFAEAWSEHDLRRFLSLPGHVGFLAELEARPVGFALARFAGDEAEILTIAVDPSCQRRGIGRSLVEALGSTLLGQGIRRLFIEVAVDNDAALCLYRSTGFVEVGRRAGYYQRPGGAVDALVMRRES
ncbi:MAG: ribosomal-protein-alanine N-acetyltransferase [Alphaproteobacteria bacterium]|nr:ribosomal-protein-alanine N-acetyltransferase [Alphaproteobacteria bacterium]